MMQQTRRCFLGRTSLGLGALALAELAGLVSPAGASVASTQPAFPNHSPRAKRVIFLYMSGGPSQLETFDYKPKLIELDGQPIAQLQGQALKCLAPQTKFRRYGQSGQEISDFLPWTAKLADEIAIIRSMTTDQINHDPAHTVMNTGTSISGRPSIGSWVLYGLGSESRDLPGFIVLTSQGGRNP